MRTALWVLTVVMGSFLAGLLGYATSSRTGVEPGYFEATETGGYGAPAASQGGGEELDPALQEYYKNLTTE